MRSFSAKFMLIACSTPFSCLISLVRIDDVVNDADDIVNDYEVTVSAI